MKGRKVVVVDTPSFFHTSHSNTEIATEVSKGVKFCAPGPHVILQVMHPGRFTQNEKEVAQLIKEIFGLKAKNYIILLFTRKDDLKGESLENFISAQDENLKEYIAECGNLAFNNEDEGAEREAQVAKLMTHRNKYAPCYTQDMMNF
ncbi:GTPase IMAP family member 3, partial [Ophiophagus hannah]